MVMTRTNRTHDSMDDHSRRGCIDRGRRRLDSPRPRTAGSASAGSRQQGSGEAAPDRRAQRAQRADAVAGRRAADGRGADAGAAADQQLQRADHQGRRVARVVREGGIQPRRAARRGRAGACVGHAGAVGTSGSAGIARHSIRRFAPSSSEFRNASRPVRSRCRRHAPAPAPRGRAAAAAAPQRLRRTTPTPPATTPPADASDRDERAHDGSRPKTEARPDSPPAPDAAVNPEQQVTVVAKDLLNHVEAVEVILGAQAAAQKARDGGGRRSGTSSRRNPERVDEDDDDRSGRDAEPEPARSNQHASQGDPAAARKEVSQAVTARSNDGGVLCSAQTVGA